MTDRYRDYAELSAHEREGRDYLVTARAGTSGALVLAPHAGGIEPGTGELARLVAGERHALYLFEGTKARGNGELHVTSTRFDEPRCAALLGEADRVVALHGCQGSDEVVYAGGRDEALLRRVEQALAAAGFRVEAPAEAHLAGQHPANVCNRGRSGAGVQLELTRGLRGACFVALSAAGRGQPTPTAQRLAEALGTALAG